MSERIQFVDSISDTATVRLDIDSAPWQVLARGTSTPPPPLRRIIAQSFLADGAIIPDTAWDNRTITLALRLASKDSTVAATQHQKLNRELNRDNNILRWQPDTSIPALYFRTFRSPDYTTDFDYGIGLYDFSVTLVAEPFGYGVQQSLGNITVNNDPVAGSNPCYFDTSAVIGDVDTPLYISTATNIANTTTLMSSRRRGTPSGGVYFVQAEAMTQGTDTTTVAGGATFSGASNNESTTTFATSSYADRLTAVLPSATASAELRGTYRVFARQKKSASGSTMHGTLRIAGIIDNPEVTIPDSTNFMWNDYGLLQIPMGMQGLSDGYGPPLGALGISCAFRFNRTSGTGSLLTDYIYLVPADTELSTVHWPSTPAGPNWVYDGPNDDVYWRGTAGVAHAVSASGGAFPDYIGGLPMVSPNQANRVFFAVMDGAVTASTVLAVSYWPRYLSMRPVTT